MDTDFIRPYHVLFLCTGNSARSIISEAVLNDLGQTQNGPPKFLAWSAGSHPSGQPHPDALAELGRRGHHTAMYRSKSWDEFAQIQGDETGEVKGDVPVMDIIVTVCDNAAGEICPIWPRRHKDNNGPVQVHWPAPDPAYIENDAARRQAFVEVYDMCRARISALAALPYDALVDKAALQAIANIKK